MEYFDVNNENVKLNWASNNVIFSIP